MLTEDAIKIIQRTAIDAEGNWFHHCSRDPYAFYVRQIKVDGSSHLERRAMERARRVYKLDTLNDLALAIERFRGDHPCLILCGGDRIVAILQEPQPMRDSLFLSLTQTTQFQALLQQHEHATAFTQRQFISLLRISLNGCVDPTAIALVRSLQFKKTEAGASTIQSSKESLGREIVATATQGGDNTPIPETMTLHVTPFEEFADDDQFRFELTCALELDMQDAEFRLIPLAGELVRVEKEALKEIANRLNVLLSGDSADRQILLGSLTGE